MWKRAQTLLNQISYFTVAHDPWWHCVFVEQYNLNFVFRCHLGSLLISLGLDLSEGPSCIAQVIILKRAAVTHNSKGNSFFMSGNYRHLEKTRRCTQCVSNRSCCVTEAENKIRFCWSVSGLSTALTWTQVQAVLDKWAHTHHNSRAPK